MIRPRLKENEANQYQLRKLWDKKLYSVLITSDHHGWLTDLRANRCVNNILQHHKFDEVILNGDIVDLPYLSKHTQKLFPDGILSGYSEVGEFEYTTEQILKPLSLSTKALIRVRTGNHDERVTKPNLLGDKQLKSLAILYKHFESTKFDEMLKLADMGIVYDPSDVYTLFDIFDVVHGLKLAKNAAEQNIKDYMSSGSSGHTHRLNSKYMTNRKSPYVWLESGCMRLITQVEYLPTGVVADWQNGFVTVHFWIEGDKVRFYAQPNIIIDGRCYYNGVVYDGNKV
jgi:predicted phosphodiesterase